MFDTNSTWKFLTGYKTSTLPLSKKLILHQSKFVSECFKLPFCQGLGQNIKNLVIYWYILELHYYLLNLVFSEVILNLNVLVFDVKK